VRTRATSIVLALAAVAYLLAAETPWHADAAVRRATGIVLAMLVLWISEIAPLGVLALLIPVAAMATGLLSWSGALSVWGDPIIFLNVGAFLLARALDKHGAFDWLLSEAWWKAADSRLRSAGAPLLVLLTSGMMSSVQNNTAVTAMLLPVVTTIARRSACPPAVLMALSLGATLGGMATPIGTAPNFIGYAAMKRIDPAVSFVSWMKVGLAVWLGGTLLSWAVLAISRRWLRTAPDATAPEDGWLARAADADLAPAIIVANEDDAARRRGRRAATAALLAAATAWVGTGIIKGIHGPGTPAFLWCERYLPESLVPIAAAWVLFLVPVAPGRGVLERRDFQLIDWDTVFLFAGGLCLGRTLESSGAADALAVAVSRADLPPLALLFVVAGATVILSELTSNTATAALMVPVAAALAPVVGMDAPRLIWTVALTASLGFALPVSTPPNALIYGTRLVPLRWMIAVGMSVDVLCVGWVVACISLLG